MESKPTQTLEFVETLTFLDTIQDEIDEKEGIAEIAKQLYTLIEEYKVPTPPEDLAVYQTLKPSMDAVRNSIDKSLGMLAPQQ